MTATTGKTQRANKAASVIERLGPGLITGAADDDPSGIATYSQAGAQFGLGLIWTALFCLPLMIAIQSICARIGCVTGMGLAGNIKRVFPGWLLISLVALLLVANTLNIAADVAAMGAAAKLVAPGVPVHVYVAAFGVVSLLLQVFVSYTRYVNILKWLTLSLLAYVAVIFFVKIDWMDVAAHTLIPRFALNRETITMIVAVLGTTISPYLFFWQSSQEVEELEKDESESNAKHARIVTRHLKRIGPDTIVGMAFSELIAFFVILTAAVTLHAHGVKDIDSAAQAAEALRPIAGPFASLLFSLGIIGTGFLAIPVLAGSAAYALAETWGWPHGLNMKLLQAKQFYAIIAVAILGGVGLGFTPIDPIKALVWSAVINGVAAVPIMIVTMLIVQRKDVMRHYTATLNQRIFGWGGTALMGLAAIALLYFTLAPQ